MADLTQAVARGDLSGRDAEYIAAMDRLAMCARLMADEPLDQMLETVERAHALGPILHPSEYIHGGRRLQDQEKLIRAAMSVRAAVREIGGDSR